MEEYSPFVDRIYTVRWYVDDASNERSVKFDDSAEAWRFAHMLSTYDRGYYKQVEIELDGTVLAATYKEDRRERLPR